MESALHIGQIGPGRAGVAPLVRALKDPSELVRGNAIASLAMIGPDAAEAVDALIPFLAAGPQRSNAAYALGSIGEAAVAAIPALMEALDDPEPYTRNTAANALGLIGPGAADAVPAIIRMLDDPDGVARVGAANGIGLMGVAATPAVPVLLRMIEDESQDIRVAATFALQNLGPHAAAAAPRLTISLREGKTHWVRAASANALAAMGEVAQSSIPSLRQALEDEHPMVRTSACHALRRFTPEDPGCRVGGSPVFEFFIDRNASRSSAPRTRSRERRPRKNWAT
jgi:HEAT repeat protein